MTFARLFIFMKLIVIHPLEFITSDSPEIDSCNDYPASDMEISFMSASFICNPISISRTPLPFNPVGDNTDKNIRPRYVRASIHRTKSLHYLHSYAISFKHLPYEHPPHYLPLKKSLAELLLPYKSQDDAIQNNLSVLVQCCISYCCNIHFNKSFADVTDQHIQHLYYE